MRLRNAGFHPVETLSVMVPVASGFGATINHASLCPAPAIASLRVRIVAAKVHWMGRSVILSHQLFPVFQRLLEKALSRDQAASGSYVEGATGREAKDLIRELRAAFVAAGFTRAEAETLIVTVRSRGYRLGILIMTGANSAVGLRSTPARYIFLDEVDILDRFLCIGLLGHGFLAHLRSSGATMSQKPSVTQSA